MCPSISGFMQNPPSQLCDSCVGIGMGESEWETVMHFPGPLVLGLVGVVWEYWGFVLIFFVCFAFHLGGHRIRTVRKKSSCCLRL